MRINVYHNLANDIREVVEDEIMAAGGTYIAGLIAANVVERLRRDDPELLAKFLDQNALVVVRGMVNDIARSDRQRARNMSTRQRSASVFADAVQRYEDGDDKALAPWLDTVYVVTTANQRKQLRDMGREDLEYAASDYTRRAEANAAQAAFLRALANKVGALTVGDMYTDEELARMWRSLA